MAIFNTKRTINAEIRRYGPAIQKEITYKKAKAIAATYDDLLRIQWELINPFE